MTTVTRDGLLCIVKSDFRLSDRAREMLKKDGFRYHFAAREWRGKVRHYAKYKAMEGDLEESRKSYQQTLCVGCANAGHGDHSPCPWEARFEPVPGWDAERYETRYTRRNSRGQTVDVVDETYLVKGCPLYVPDPPREINRETLAGWYRFIVGKQLQ